MTLRRLSTIGLIRLPAPLLSQALLIAPPVPSRQWSLAAEILLLLSDPGRNVGAGEGNRTLVCSLGSCRSASGIRPVSRKTAESAFKGNQSLTTRSQNELGPDAAVIQVAIEAAKPTSDELDRVARLLWQAFGEGQISDNEAGILSGRIEELRSGLSAVGQAQPIKKLIGGTTGSRLARRHRSQCRDDESRRKSRDRRRMLGGSSALPPNLRCLFTQGEQAVLTVVANEVIRHGRCDMCIDEIGARAGVGRTTVQNAVHEACRNGLIKKVERPQRGRKSLTNVIEIISKQWLVWLGNRPSRRGSKVSEFSNTTKTKIQESSETLRKERPLGIRANGWDRPYPVSQRRIA